MITTPGMGLTAWNSPTDIYSNTQLATNWAKVDQHNHAPGKGVPIPADGIAPGAITTEKFAPGAFDTLEIPDGSVSTAKVVDLAITTGKLNDLAVTTGKLNNLAVTGAKIANATITETQLAAASVGTSELQSDAVTNAKIGLAAVASAQLATGSVTSGKMASNAVTTGSISAGAVTSPKVSLTTDTGTLGSDDTAYGTGAWQDCVTITGLTVGGTYLIIASLAVSPFSTSQGAIQGQGRVTDGSTAIATLMNFTIPSGAALSISAIHDIAVQTSGAIFHTFTNTSVKLQAGPNTSSDPYTLRSPGTRLSVLRIG